MVSTQSTVLRSEVYQDPHLEVDFARASASLDARRMVLTRKEYAVVTQAAVRILGLPDDAREGLGGFIDGLLADLPPTSQDQARLMLRVVEHEVSHRPRRHGRTKYGTLDRLAHGVVDLLGMMWLVGRRLPPADEVEELLIEQMRQLGNETMCQWASQAEERVSRELKEQDIRRY